MVQVRYTKKVLVEEGHSMPHLIHIWQLLVRHALYSILPGLCIVSSFDMPRTMTWQSHYRAMNYPN